MRLKKPIYKDWFFWVVIIGVIAFFVSSQFGKSAKEEAVQLWINQEVTPDAVKTVLGHAKGGLAVSVNASVAFRSIEVTDHEQEGQPAGKKVHVHVNVGGYGAEIAVRRVGESVAVYSEVLMKNPQVHEVTVSGYDELKESETSWVDQEAVNLTWSRATREQADVLDDILASLKDNFSLPYVMGERYWLHPLVYSNLKVTHELQESKG